MLQLHRHVVALTLRDVESPASVSVIQLVRSENQARLSLRGCAGFLRGFAFGIIEDQRRKRPRGVQSVGNCQVEMMHGGCLGSTEKPPKLYVGLASAVNTLGREGGMRYSMILT